MEQKQGLRRPESYRGDAKRPRFPMPVRVGTFEHPVGSGVWWICYYISHRLRREKIGSREAAIEAFEVHKRDAKKATFPVPSRVGAFEHPAGSSVWWICYYVNHHRRREKIGSREAAIEAWAVRDERLVKHAGVFERPAGSGIWWICYYAGRQRRREKIGSREAAIEAYEARKRDVHVQITATKHAKRRPFPTPARAGTFEHPAGSGVWWICYYVNHHRRREKIGSREAAAEAWAAREQSERERKRDVLWGTQEKTASTKAAIKAARSTPEQKKLQSELTKSMWADEEKKAEIIKSQTEAFNAPEMRETRSKHGLRTSRNPEIAAKREVGRKKAVVAAADPEVRARGLAKKMRDAAAVLGNPWTDEQAEQVAQELLRRAIARRSRQRPRRSARLQRKRGAAKAEIWRAAAEMRYEQNLRWRPIARRLMPDEFRPDATLTPEKLRQNQDAATHALEVSVKRWIKKIGWEPSPARGARPRD